MPAPVAGKVPMMKLPSLKTIDEYAALKGNGSDVSAMEEPIRKLAVKAKLDEEIPYHEKKPFADMSFLL